MIEDRRAEPVVEPGGFMTSNWLRACYWAPTVLVCGGLIASPLAAQQAAQPAKPAELPELVVEGKAKSKPKAAKKAPAKAKPAAVAKQAPPPQPAPDPAASTGGSTAPGAVDGYVAKESSVGTKTATPLNEIPQSITTVTRQQLEDRKPYSIEDVMGYVPGARTNGAGFDPRFDCVNIRGFDCLSGDSLFRDGLRQMGSPFGIFRNEIYGLDSITVLRGPSSMIYGAGSAGGILDMYTKRPTATPFNEVEFLIGNHDRFQGNFDFSGPIAPGSSTLYRMTGVVRDSDTQQLGVEDDRLYLAPSLTFKPDDDTKVTVFGEYMDSNAGGNMAYWNDPTGDHSRRTDIVSGDPNFNDFKQEQWRVGYEIDHRVNSVLTLRQKARYASLDSRLEYIDIAIPLDVNGDPAIGVGPLDAVGLPVNGIYPRATGTLTDTMHTAVIDNIAEAKFATGPLRHTVLAGFDASYLTYNEAEGFQTDDIDYDNDGNPISIDIGSRVPPLINFNYGKQYIPDPTLIARTNQDLFAMGAYLQDQIKFDRWVLTLGGRRDWVETDTTWQNLEQGTTTSQDKNDAAWSGRAALGYLFDSGFSPYVAYATSFTPTAGTSPPDEETQAAFDPTTAKSKEVGFKLTPRGTNVLLAGSLFDIEQENGLVSESFDRAGVTLSRLVQTGVLRSRGGEIEAAASFGNGFSLLASYSYIDMTIVEGGDPENNGNILSSIPRHTASMWLDYTIKYGPAKGLGFGGGVRYIGSSFGDDENTFKNDDRTFLDLAAHYELVGLDSRFNGARLQLNVNNVADLEKDICQSDYCYRDKGRTILGSLRYRW